MAHAHLTCSHSHCLAPSRTVDAPHGHHDYGRLFPDLPPLIADEAALWALGEAGGPCDGSLFADSEGGDDARDVAAGWPFFGQFIAHDITADRSLPAHQADPAALRNARNPTIDLEFLYGDGPSSDPRNDMHLGPLGGRIVGEVLVAIFENDPGSFRAAEPEWTPTLPSAHPGMFGLSDLLRFAARS